MELYSLLLHSPILAMYLGRLGTVCIALHFNCIEVQNMHMLYLPIFVEICRQILKFCRFCRQKNMMANWKLLPKTLIYVVITFTM